MSHLATWVVEKSFRLRPLTSNFSATSSNFAGEAVRWRRGVAGPQRRQQSVVNGNRGGLSRPHVGQKFPAPNPPNLHILQLNMFTGLIEEVGEVRWIRRRERGTQLQLAAPIIAAGLREGESVAVNGCCLTATTIREGGITFDLLEETLERTNLRTLRPESPVNLERALVADGRVGGHFVQGHIDCTARVLDFTAHGADHRLEVELPDAFAPYVAVKGSIALNGISLTIAELLPASFVVWIIPHTRRATNLAQVQPNDFLNIEFDLIAKYIERMLPRMMVERK